MSVDTLSHLLALYVTAANEQDRTQVEQLAQQAQAVTGVTVEVAFVDQGYTGDKPASDGTKVPGSQPPPLLAIWNTAEFASALMEEDVPWTTPLLSGCGA